MSNKKFYLVNVIPSNERRCCFFFTLEKTESGIYSFKISHYYPTNIKKKVSIRSIQSLPFNDWHQFRCPSKSMLSYLTSDEYIFNEFCFYFMISKSGTTYTIRECYL